MTPPSAGLAGHPAALAMASRHRLRPWEPIPWILALAVYFAFPKHLGFGTELLVTILFALSLDLVLGYAGIVTLGHAAFFGAGAYAVGMLAKHGVWNEPITGLILAAGVAAAVGLGSGLVLLRTRGLTLLMLTLCTMALLEEAANLGHAYTGGFDGLDSLPIRPLFGVFEFNPLYPTTQYLYVLAVLFVCFVFVRTLVYSPFGQSLAGIRENTLADARGRGAGARAARHLLHRLGGDRRGRGRDLGAGQRVRQPGHARPGPRGDGAHHPRPRRGAGASTAPSSAPSPTWRSRTFWRRSIPPHGSSDWGFCSSSSRCSRGTAFSASSRPLASGRTSWGRGPTVRAERKTMIPQRAVTADR